MAKETHYYFRLDEEGRLTLELTKMLTMEECIRLTLKCIEQMKDDK